MFGSATDANGMGERLSETFGRVRCGRCGWLIEQGDDWRSGDEYGPEHVECRGTPPFPPPFSPRIWSHNWWGEPE
jgi:hypothetical protein